ncbi:unnamed protein product [Lota lota]
MTIMHLAAGTAKKREEQSAVKKTAPPRFLPPQEPRPAQVKMLFKRARLVGGFSGAERETMPPRCFPPLDSTPAMLFKRGPLAQTVLRPKPEKNPGNLKGAPSIGVDSNVCGVEVRAENKKACAWFLTPLEPRQARIWKRARLAQGLRSQPKESTGASSDFSMPLPSTGCLCNFRCVCWVGCKARAKKKVAPLLFMPLPEPRTAKLFKLGLLAEGVRKAETSGGFEQFGVGGFGCVSGDLSPTRPTPLVVGRPIRTTHHELPSLLSSQNNIDSENLSIWGSALGAGLSGLGQVQHWPTAPVGRLIPVPRLESPSAFFTLKGEKHWGIPTRGRRITSRGMVRA